MRARTIRSQVSVNGPDVFGRPAWICFAPHPHEEPGWYWSIQGELVPIDWRIAVARRRRIMLMHEGSRLEIWEHIGGLRFTGLDSVIVSGSHFPPYDGGSALFWNALKPFIVDMGRDISWQHIPKKSMYQYQNNSGRASVLTPSTVLRLDVTTAYSLLGLRRREIDLPREREWFIEHCIPSKSQGYPHGLAYMVRRIETLRDRLPESLQFPWLRVSQNVCLGDFPARSVAKRWHTHRVLDLCGALSLIDHQSLPLCRVTSIKSGHLGDLEAIKGLFA